MLNAATIAATENLYTTGDRAEIVALLAKALTKAEADALRAVAAGGVTFYYRNPPKIKNSRLVVAKSAAWHNKKMADGVSSMMLQRLYDNKLVTDRGSYGVYAVKMTSFATEVLAASGK